MMEPLIALCGVGREFPAGENTVVVLRDINLTIEAGEMVAIMGASGSGKSTLMNILGCLDRPSEGSYRIYGRETAALDPDELAALRREHFGFIFQRYHLLPELTALGNVEIPAIYAGQAAAQRRQRAIALLDRLGMDQRLNHRPGQLSGGQQQRVSIARALMNGADVVLADEPTGALDSHSGEEVLRILEELHAEGRTVIIITHDVKVARRAQRIIELSDGQIAADRRIDNGAKAAQAARVPTRMPGERRMNRVRAWSATLDRLRAAFGIAVLAMLTHRLRTFLTMLGIIIGTAAVVCVVALGQGSQQQVLANISNLGTNTLEIFPGRDFGDVRSDKITTLVLADAIQLAQQTYVAAATPTVSTSSTLRFGAKEATALVNGVSEQYFEARGTKLSEGRFFGADSTQAIAQDVVIDENTRKALFADTSHSPIGQVIFVGRVPCRVVGVTKSQEGGFGSSQNLSVYLPYTTVQTRFLGDQTLRSITLRVKDEASMAYAEQATTAFMTQRHGVKDFFILNTADIRDTITSTNQTMTLLISAIAVISLLVGGIGVMNIMLVSVSERVGEIGLRMAVGARRSDILRQFLIEAVLVCLFGGVLGIVLALGFGVAFSAFSKSFALIYSFASIVAAVLCSTAIGGIFGYLPARNASHLDPALALTEG